MTPEDFEKHAGTLDLINREIASRLDRQTDSTAKIDTKASLVIGYTIAAASFLATRHAQPVLAALAFIAYTAAVGFGIASLAVWNYKDIKPRTLVAYANASQAGALAPLISRRVMDFETNDSRQRRKAVQWWISLTALLLGAVLMVAAILVQTYDHGRAEQRRTVTVHPSEPSKHSARPSTGPS
jgi:hypothetical protein